MLRFTRQLETAHWGLDVAPNKRILRLVRSWEPLTSAEQVHQSFLQPNQVIHRFPGRYWGLLFDMRLGRPAHAPEVEEAFRENHQRNYRMIARIGVLVGSAAGLLQMRRLLIEAPDPRVRGFDHEPQALDWVSAKTP